MEMKVIHLITHRNLIRSWPLIKNNEFIFISSFHICSMFRREKVNWLSKKFVISTNVMKNKKIQYNKRYMLPKKSTNINKIYNPNKLIHKKLRCLCNKNNLNRSLIANTRVINIREFSNNAKKNDPEITYIHGKTGSGKTTNIINTAIEILKQNKNDKKILVISLFSKQGVSHIFNEIKKGSGIVSKDNVVKWTADDQTREYLCITEKVFPKIIITTHTYIIKRGDSNFHYPIFLDFHYLQMCGYTLLLKIDEGHLFLDSLVWSLKVRGLYSEEPSVDNTKILRPLSGFINHIKGEYKGKHLTTSHQFVIDPVFHTPKIVWENNRRQYDLKSFTFNKKRNEENKVQIQVLNTSYVVSKNRAFNSKAWNDTKIKIHPPIDDTTNIKKIANTFKNSNIIIDNIHKLNYNSVINHLHNITPTFTECTNYTDVYWDNNSGKTALLQKEEVEVILSGADYYSLWALTLIFSKIDFYSASFLTSNIDVWKYLGLSIKEKDLTQYGNDDFGTILFIKPSMSIKNLKAWSDLGNMIHFAKNKKSFRKMESSCLKDDYLRHKTVTFDRIYRNEHKTLKSSMILPVETTPQPISLSYIGSSLSTGTNMDEISINSIDLMHHIPFIYIPYLACLNEKTVFRLTYDFMTERVIQVLSRSCRHSGNKFKVLLVNNAIITKMYDEKEYSNTVIYDIIKRVSFQQKFKKFKWYLVKENSDDLINYVSHLIKKNELIVASPHTLEIDPIDRDLQRFNHQKISKFLPIHISSKNTCLDSKIKHTSIHPNVVNSNVPKKTSMIDLVNTELNSINLLKNDEEIKEVVKPVPQSKYWNTRMLSWSTNLKPMIDKKKSNGPNENWYEMFFKLDIIGLTIEYDRNSINIVMKNFQLNKTILSITLNSNSTNFKLTNIKYNKKCVFFVYNKQQWQLFCYLWMHHNLNSSFAIIMKGISNVQNPPSSVTKEINNKFFGIYYLSKGLSVKNVPSLKRMGTFLDIPTLEPESSFFNHPDYTKEKNEINITILYKVYLEIFNEDKVKVYETFLLMLRSWYFSYPSLKEIVWSFLETPVAKWYSRYIPALELPNVDFTNVNQTKGLCTVNILKFTKRLKWHNLELLNEIEEIFNNKFISKRQSPGFLYLKDQNPEPVSFPIKLDKVILNLKSGGLHSVHVPFTIQSDINNKIFDLDIESFYGYVLTENKLLSNDKLRNFLSTCYKLRKAAIKNNKKYENVCFKSIINCLSGNLTNVALNIYDINARFNLVMMSQIIVLNWIDCMLVNEYVDIYDVNTDGLIIHIKNSQNSVVENTINKIKEWGYSHNMTIKVKELEVYDHYDSSVVFKIFKNGDIYRTGLNKFNNIQPGLSFNFNTPLIVVDTYRQKLNNQQVQDILKTDIKKGIYYIEDTKYNSYSLLYPDGKKHKLNGLRYMIGYDTNIKLTVDKVNHFGVKTTSIIINHIIPLDRYDNLSKYKISVEYYLKKKDTSLIIEKKKDTPSINMVYDHSKLKTFWENNKDIFNFIPVLSNGHYCKGSLDSNIITEYPDKSVEYSGLALLSNYDRYMVIDVDNSNHLCEEIKKYFIEHESDYMFCHHSTTNIPFENIIKEGKFKVIFLFNNYWKNHISDIVNKYAFSEVEIKTTKKAYTIMGYHRNGNSVYKLYGVTTANKLNYASSTLLKLLRNSKKTWYSNRLESTARSKFFILNNVPMKFALNIIELYKKKYNAIYTHNISKQDSKTRIVSYCPFKSLHKSKSGHAEFNLYYIYQDNIIVGACFHSGCQTALHKKLSIDFNEQRYFMSNINNLFSNDDEIKDNILSVNTTQDRKHNMSVTTAKDPINIDDLSVNTKPDRKHNMSVTASKDSINIDDLSVNTKPDRKHNMSVTAPKDPINIDDLSLESGYLNIEINSKLKTILNRNDLTRWTEKQKRKVEIIKDKIQKTIKVNDKQKINKLIQSLAYYYTDKSEVKNTKSDTDKVKFWEQEINKLESIVNKTPVQKRKLNLYRSNLRYYNKNK